MGDTKNTCENSGEEKYTQHRVPSSKFHRTRNGSVVTWGHPKYGGDSDIVEQLRQLGDQKMMAVAGMFHEKKTIHLGYLPCMETLICTEW